MRAIRRHKLGMNIVQIVNSVFASNTYLLSHKNSNSVWLIDIGDINSILAKMPDNYDIRGVFITHTHYDHIYGIRELIKRFPFCKIFTSEHGRHGFLSDKYNFSRYHNDPIKFTHPNIKTITEGDIIQLASGYALKIFETPGHDWSSITYQLGDNWLFTGDSYIPGSKVVTSFPKSNKEQSLISLAKIHSLCTYSTILYPGHGEVVNYSNLS